jgi:valyl-tRNA synthetase
VPFITEALWENLSSVRPRRGIDKAVAGDGLLIRAAWPEAVASWVDERADRDMDILRVVVRAVRNWRSAAGVPPSKKLAAVVKAAGAEAESVRRATPGIAHLAALKSLEMRPDFDRPRTAAGIVESGLEIFLLEAVDVDAESKRLKTALERARRELDKIEKRLGNPSFLDKAPAGVVAEERRRLEAARNDITLLEARLRDLGG